MADATCTALSDMFLILSCKYTCYWIISSFNEAPNYMQAEDCR